MGVDAPDEKAQKIADKLMGKQKSDNDIASLIAGNVSVGRFDEKGNPTDKVSTEEYRAQSKPKSKAKAQAEPDDDGDEWDEDTDLDDEDGEDGDEIDTGEEDQEADDSEDDADEEDGDDFEEAEYDDEDTLEVKVDGELKEVSLRELKRVYSLNEATEKRLKEATEARAAANAEREEAQVEIQQHRVRMLRTIQQLDGVLFAPMVNKPDPKLRQTSMTEYLQHKDAYEEDQKRIAESREQLAQFLGKEQKAVEEERAKYRNYQQVLLSEKMPELLDPTKAQKVQKDILDAATYYGFTPEMVAEVDHHGLFLMARDAARYLKMKKAKEEGTLPTSRESSGKIKRKVQKLKGGTPTGVKRQLVRSQKEQRMAENRARETGKVDDVANLLLSKARNRGTRDGRSR